MMLLTSAVGARSPYWGFGVGLTRGGRLRAQAVPIDAACRASTSSMVRRALPQGLRQCRRLGKGPVLLLLLPAATAAQQELWQEHLHILLKPCSAFRRLQWVAISPSLAGTEIWKHQQTTQQDIKVCAQALLLLALGALTR